MDRMHVVGCETTLCDNLRVVWDQLGVPYEFSPFDEMTAAIEQIQLRPPAWVVYCGRASASSWGDSLEAAADEAGEVARLACASSQAGSRLAVVSSDRVFTRPQLFHEEQEPPGDDPLAQRLRAIEQAALVAEGARDVLIVRTNAIGWSARQDSLVERVWVDLSAGRLVELSATTFATPILASQFAELLLRACRARLNGVIHIAGAERASPFQVGQALAMAGGFDRRLVRPLAIHDFPQASQTALETSLATRLIRRELQISLPLLRETIAAFVDQSTDGFRERLAKTTPDRLSRAA
jgi:dTDP-4-dehydrorhamnose reductase